MPDLTRAPSAREIENALIDEIDRLSGGSQAQRSRDRQVDVAELMSLERAAFVEAVYRSVLGREADPEGLEHHLELLEAGSSKLDIVLKLRSSPEGELYGSSLLNLPERQSRYARLFALPVVGRFLQLAASLARIGVLKRDVQGLHESVVALQRSTDNILKEQRNSVEALRYTTRKETLSLLETKTSNTTRLLQEIRSRLEQLESADHEPWSEPLLAIADRQDFLSDRLDLLDNVDELQKTVALISDAFKPMVNEPAETRAERIVQAARSLRSQEGRIRSAESLAEEAHREMIDQRRRLGLLLETIRRRPGFDKEQIATLEAERDHLLDSLYFEFEARFRGSPEMIQQRQRVHLPVMVEARAGTPDRPIIDVGAGRGEWLDLLRAEGQTATGIDTNEAMVEACRRLGVDCVLGDAVTELSKRADGSVGAVTGFHIIEHLPFRTMVALFDESLRVLAPGGVVLFETPNPANLQVASRWFYLDPTHRNPLPSEMVAMIAEARGFCRVRVEALHPARQSFDASDKRLGEQLDALFYGPQDYALLGYKA